MPRGKADLAEVAGGREPGASSKRVSRVGLMEQRPGEERNPRGTELGASLQVPGLQAGRFL